MPLHGIRLATEGRVAQVPLSGGVSLSRETFDAALVNAAIEAGAAFLPQTTAALISEACAPMSAGWIYVKKRCTPRWRRVWSLPPMG